MKEKKYKNIRRGDLKKVANSLDVEYDKVREVKIGRKSDPIIEATLEKLDVERAKEVDRKSSKAVKDIINQ